MYIHTIYGMQISGQFNDFRYVLYEFQTLNFIRQLISQDKAFYG